MEAETVSEGIPQSVDGVALVESSPRAKSPLDSFDDMSPDGLMPRRLTAKDPGAKELGKSEPEPESPAAPEAQAAPTAETEKVTQKTARKVIKALLDGDEAVDVPLDAKVEYEVNGVPVVRTVQEWLRTASGTENVDRLYAKFKQKEESFTSFISEFVQKSKTPQGALQALREAAERQGHDPVEFIRTLRSGLVEDIRNWDNLPEEQKALLEAEDEKSYYKSKLDRAAQEAEKRKALELHEEARAQTAEKYGMSIETFDEIATFLENERKAGRITLPQITYEDVGVFHKTVQQDQKARSTEQVIKGVIERVDPNLVEDQETIDLLKKVQASFDPTPEEMEETLRELLSEQTKEEEPDSSSSDERSVRNLSEKVISNGVILKTESKSEQRTAATPNYRKPSSDW